MFDDDDDDNVFDAFFEIRLLGSSFLVTGLALVSFAFSSFSLFGAGLTWTCFESGFWFSSGDIFDTTDFDLMVFYY